MKFSINATYIIAILILLFNPTTIHGQSTNINTIDKRFENSFEHARYVFHNAYFEKAHVLFDSIIIKNHNFALSYGYAAMLDNLLFKDPTNNINKAISLSRETDANHLITLALCSFAQGDLSDCEIKIKDFLSLYPDDKYGLHILGFTQTDLDRPEDGLQTLINLVNKHPSYSGAQNHIGYAYLKLNQHDNALDAFYKFLKADTLNPSAMDSYAEGLAAKGQYNLAIAYLTKAVLLEPSFAYGWMHMGDIFKLNGEFGLADKAYSNAKESASIYGENFTTYIDKKIETLKK